MDICQILGDKGFEKALEYYTEKCAHNKNKMEGVVFNEQSICKGKRWVVQMYQTYGALHDGQ